MKEGDRIPQVKFRVRSLGDWIDKTTNDYFKGKRVILFSLPGAFTPTCSNKHLPSFLQSKEQLKKKNIDKVFCISVNDPFVMEAWGKSFNLNNQLILLADVRGDFTKSIGADFNWRGWGMRSKRYTMFLDNGVIKKIVEEEGKCELTAADNFLKII